MDVLFSADSIAAAAAASGFRGAADAGGFFHGAGGFLRDYKEDVYEEIPLHNPLVRTDTASLDVNSGGMGRVDNNENDDDDDELMAAASAAAAAAIEEEEEESDWEELMDIDPDLLRHRIKR